VTDTTLIQLKEEVKSVIIKTLNINKIDPASIDTRTPLFAPDNPFGLDSVDAIDIIMTVQKHFDAYRKKKRVDLKQWEKDILF